MIDHLEPDPQDPAYDYIRGNPEKIIGASCSPRVLVVWLHGNEHLGARVGHHISTYRPDLLKNVDYLCGNPKAAARLPQSRYTGPEEGVRGTDMNRSFGGKLKPRSYEERRAAQWLERIRQYDFVLDLHTSTTDCGEYGRFLVVARPDYPPVTTMISATDFERVIVMPESIYAPSLIGQVPSSISIEVNQKIATTPAALCDIICIIERLITPTTRNAREREFFYVDAAIPREADPGPHTPNFIKCEDGYFPVLLGLNSYREDEHCSHVGFRATRRSVRRR